ncbi:MAG: flagellar basal body L-ring protein FlgH [Planctomycetes bacterium]|nr:flagellar basal body L-ring protein FlgH [Planctomycetota bacterium]
MRHRKFPLMLGVACLLLAPFGTAAAQTNSLFRTGQRTAAPAPTSQPAGTVQAPARNSGVRTIVADPDAPPPPNPALLQSSLIAVQVPKPKKFRVNDLVTVIVREDKRSQTDAKLQEDKKWDVKSTLDSWIRLNVHDQLVPQSFAAGTPEIGFQWDDKYGGQGKAERKDSLTTRITATIIDVKPNGTLVLEDIKTIKTDEDVQILRLTGVCRSEDVTPDNTVLSTQLAKATIETEHTGPGRDASRRGWLKKAVDFLRPF